MAPSVWMNPASITSVSDLITSLSLQRDTYEDPCLYPPPDDDIERQMVFFAAMVAIDHRTSTPLTKFELSGKRKLRGADLLYYLGVRTYKETPAMFTAEGLMNLKVNEARRILCTAETCVWDLHTRIFLLRDLGKKVVEYYGGKFENLLRVETISQLSRRLEPFRAYEDPVKKKTFLLAKFLEGRGLVKFRDPENFQVAVDNHLTRLALRLGIVRLSEDYYRRIERSEEFTSEEDYRLRLAIREAWKRVSMRSGVDPFTLDDFLWKFGRTTCLPENPRCNSCPFSSVCFSRSVNRFWKEHAHVITWYY